MQTSKISLMSFRSQGDQRERSVTADGYLFSSDQIQLQFNCFCFLKILILKTKKGKKAVPLLAQISIAKLSVNYQYDR